MLSIYALVVTVVTIALIFDFLNGFHDAANAISTVVIAKTLTPLQAVIIAGCANFVGYFFFGTAVAKTIGTGVVDISHIMRGGNVHMSILVILAGLVGAAVWDLLTWIWGLPTSSSHALIGGLVGSAIAAAGFEVIV
ncbi:MAG TPA: inorganic phosphate transporter, partial [bacterium]|nr:inorganic phosphate transporter [bacterium]